MDIAKSIGPLVEKIEKLSKTIRIVICVVAVILVAVPFVVFSYMPQFEKIGELKKEVKSLESELRIVKKKANNLRKVEKELEDAEVKFNIAKKALPESAEIPELLTNISRAGQDAGLEFLLFEPAKLKKKKKKKGKGKGKEEDEKFYTDIPVQIEVTGNYHSVAIFFDKVSKLNRIVNIKDIKISAEKPSKNDSAKNDLTVECIALTYQFVESEKKDEKKK